MMNADEIAIAILAGGEGSRIGGNKPSVRLGSSTLLERTWKFAKALSDNVVLVLRQPGSAGSAGYPFITDRTDIEGPLAGLESALVWANEAGREAVITVPCDMPLLPPDLVERLTNEIGEKSVAIAASGGQIHPVCGLWKTDVIEPLETYSKEGRRSLQGFARAVGFAQVDWPIGAMDPFFNINRPCDLAEVQTYLETRN